MEYVKYKFGRRNTKCNLEVKIGKLSIQVSWFKYLRKIIENDRKEGRYINHKIKIGWMKWTNASGITCGRNIPINPKRKFTVQL
jgi:hypothetical protein